MTAAAESSVEKSGDGSGSGRRRRARRAAKAMDLRIEIVRAVLTRTSVSMPSDGVGRLESPIAGGDWRRERSNFGGLLGEI